MSPSATAAWARSLLARFLYAPAAQALYWTALLWRRALVGTTFVAVTGTHGKTTTKEMLATILRARGRTLASLDNTNSGLPLTLNILRARPWHRFAVIEIGVGAPGEMRRLARLVRPDVAVVLTVLRAHTKAFGDPARHAAEKAALLRALRPGGVAVLNADDPLVRRMGAGVRGRVVLSGTSPGLDVWASGAVSRWPARLEFELRTREGESCHVRTRLVGTHWCTSAAAALATARVLGVPLEDAAAAVGTMEPFVSRLQPVALPSGAVMLRDDYDGSFDAFVAALRVLEEARAGRRVAVICDVSDFGAAMKRKRVVHLGREAGRVAEVVVFVGEAAGYGRQGALSSGLAPASVHALATLEEAAAFLRATLGQGDLVLLKGRISDHVSRLYFAQLGPINCFKPGCKERIACDVCPELGIAAEDRKRATIPPSEWLAPGGSASQGVSLDGPGGTGMIRGRPTPLHGPVA